MSAQRQIKRFGWKRSLPDQRDYKLQITAPTPLPSRVDLRPGCPPVYDQGQLGSCTANAIGAAIEFDRVKQGLTDFAPSRLFIYYEERVIENSVDTDAGAEIRDGFKVISKLGAPPETDWPYDISQFAVKPPDSAYTNALKDVALQYESVNQTLNDLKSCLAAGFPLVFGFTVYTSFESEEVSKTGIVPMPAMAESILGGHAVMSVGYDDTKSQFIVRNSWGPYWGQSGYFMMPYDYLTSSDLSSDFWTLRLLSS